jgi:regulator of sigma E protease
MTNGMEFNERAEKIGFRDGDILLSADEQPLQRFDVDMLRTIAEARSVKVNRQGAEVEIFMPEISLLDIAKDSPAFVEPLISNEIDSVVVGMPLHNAGLQKGDKLLAVNGKETNSWNSFLAMMAELKESAEAEGKKKADLTLVYAREGARDTVSVQTDSLFQVGAMKSGLLDYKVTTLEYSFFESFPAGVALGVNTLKGYVNDMKYVFTKEGAKSVGGFGTLGSIFPTVWDWHRFWEMTAFLSIILAFMNILPIPALDGGHVLFLLYEIIARRKPSDKFLEYAQMAGMILLFGLLIWANFNDILRFLF